MHTLLEYLKQMAENNASDLFIVTGSRVSQKVNKEIDPVFQDDDILVKASASRLIEDVYTHAGRTMPKDVFADDDFSFSEPGLARFRINVYKQRGSLAAAIRIVPFGIPDAAKIGIPEQILHAADIDNGMILVTGAAGSGKSTTQACIIDHINNTRKAHVITLEDPVEFLHKNKKSIISQREIGLDAPDYLSALKSCLRQAPNVILLGEMRDAETIQTAITAAETGHLVIATLHTKSACATIDRIVDSFPGAQQEQARIQLSSVLRTVISQQLVPGINHDLIPAFEIMHANPSVRNLIRENHVHQIDNAIATGKSDGMIPMDVYLTDMAKKGLISEDTAVTYAINKDQASRRMAR